ncbi:sugar ABC transporter permease [Lentzea sp.]|uniref:carbohydrate ABC transporter permease n=1 Tax=Lentzea sp. TaxID=56099 RepID=UPI002ED3EE45
MANAREARAGWVFVLPWVAGFLLLTAGPMLYSLYLSFSHYDLLKPPRPAGLENYREIFQDGRAATALGNTVFFTLLHVPAQIVLALGLASLLRRAGRSAGFFRTVLFLPTMTPPVALAALFLLLLNGQNGAVNAALGWFGFTGPQWTTDPAWIKPGLVLMSLWGSAAPPCCTWRR